MIRTLGKTALYGGREFEFLNRDNETYVIFSTDKSALDLGFNKVKNSECRYMKTVKLEELSFVFEKDTEVKYKGDLFLGSSIENNKIMLYTRDVTLGKKYNMIMRDRDEYYLYVNLKDVDEITQKWIPYSQFNR